MDQDLLERIVALEENYQKLHQKHQTLEQVLQFVDVDFTRISDAQLSLPQLTSIADSDINVYGKNGLISSVCVNEDAIYELLLNSSVDHTRPVPVAGNQVLSLIEAAFAILPANTLKEIFENPDFKLQPGGYLSKHGLSHLSYDLRADEELLTSILQKLIAAEYSATYRHADRDDLSLPLILLTASNSNVFFKLLETNTKSFSEEHLRLVRHRRLSQITYNNGADHSSQILEQLQLFNKLEIHPAEDGFCEAFKIYFNDTSGALKKAHDLGILTREHILSSEKPTLDKPSARI